MSYNTVTGGTVHTSGGTLGGNVLAPAFLEQDFVPALRASTFVRELGRESTLIENNGKTVRWNIMTQPAVATSITEGADGTDVAFTTSSVTATLAEFGTQSGVTKFLMKTALSALDQEIAGGLGYQAAISYDSNCFATLQTSTNTLDAGTAMTVDYLRQAALKLEMTTTLVGAGRCLPHPKSPGGAYFIACFTPEQFYDMIGEGVPTWTQAKNSQVIESVKMPLSDTPANSAVYGCVVKKSSVLPRSTGSSPDDDAAVVFGADAFGVVSLATNYTSPQIIRTPPDQNYASAIRNWGMYGWWGLFASALMSSARVVKITSDATGIG